MTPRPRPHSDAGFVTIWMLGLCVVLLFLGGISLDLWRAFSERQALATLADAAAVAGASGIDEELFRSTGRVELDDRPGGRAETLATEHLGAQGDDRSLTGATVSVTRQAIVVEARGRVGFTLLRVFLRDDDGFDLRVTAEAEPRASS